MNSIFDFLYHDVRRVGSYLSQLDDTGYLTQVTENQGSKSDNSASGQVSGQGKIPLVASAEGKLELGRVISKNDSLERVYDPLWANARKFIDTITTDDSLLKNVADARVGEFVLLQGKVSIIDFNFLEKFFSNKGIMDSLMSSSSSNEEVKNSNRKQRRSNGKNSGSSKTGEPPILDLFSIMPFKVQLTVAGNVDAWATLDEEYLISNASDLLLKYGRSLEGEWKVLGIVDAVPDQVSLTGDHDNIDLNFGNEIDGLGIKMTQMLAPFARNMLGRPSSFYGITPLVIYRDVG